MDKATVIDTTDSDGNKNTHNAHFMFNTELMTEYGHPKIFWEAGEVLTRKSGYKLVATKL
jgi:hypothetical protein